MSETNSTDKQSTDKYHDRDGYVRSNISSSPDVGDLDEACTEASQSHRSNAQISNSKLGKLNAGTIVSVPDSGCSKDAELVGCESLLKLFEQAEADIEGFRGTGAKLRLSRLGRENLFLPMIDDGAHYLIGMKPQKMYAFLEKEQKRPMPIGRTARSELFNKGAGYQTAKKFFAWIKPLSQEFAKACDDDRYVLLEKGLKTSSNAGAWLSLLTGLQASKSCRDGHWSEHGLQLNFLERRCLADIQMLTQIRGLIDAGKLNSDDAVSIMQLMLPYWREHALVPELELKKFARAVEMHAAGRLDGDAAIIELLTSSFQLYLDFYFHLFASYEVGCLINQVADKTALKEQQGGLYQAIGRFVAAYSGDTVRHKRCCFGEWLEVIRLAISKHRYSLGVMEMSMSIGLELDPDDGRGNTKESKNYDTFRSWRNGKDRPTFERLECFFDNLANSIEEGTKAEFHFLLRSLMAIGIDELVKHWRGQLKDTNELQDTEPVMAGLYAAIGRYEVYYQHYLDKALNEIAEA